MDMFGGLTKTSSRIAIAAALGMTLGGFAVSSHPAKAADLGGDCCADLEERVAELEATTVRKGNKKVSVTLSGWLVKDAMWWDDGQETNVYIGDKDTTLSSHFQISGSATIAPGWSGGYTMSIEAPGNTNGFFTNQVDDNTTFENIVDGNKSDRALRVLLSYMWIKSDRWGTLNWGLLSQATDNVALLPDLSGTIIESNAVLFEGGGFFLRPTGANHSSKGLANSVWGLWAFCDTGGGIIGADCNGNTTNAIRYDSPTYGGFSVSSSYGEDDYWDAAVKYAADWNFWGGFKFSAAYGFTKMHDENYIFGGGGLNGFEKDDDLHQVGASVLHVPTGLFVYGQWAHEEINGSGRGVNISNGFSGNAAQDNDSWFAKVGIKRTWLPLGATVIWGEGGQYLDMFAAVANVDLCNGGGFTNAFPATKNALGPSGAFLGTAPVCFGGDNVFTQDSTFNRWGLGVVQEIDSAAMHVFARWQHQELNLSLFDATKDSNVHQGFEDLDIFQVGGVIFF
jgi:Gram-negative porin